MNFCNYEKQASRKQVSTVSSTADCTADRLEKTPSDQHTNCPNFSSSQVPAAAVFHTTSLLTFVYLSSVCVHAQVCSWVHHSWTSGESVFFYYVDSGDQTACEAWWQVPLPTEPPWRPQAFILLCCVWWPGWPEDGTFPITLHLIFSPNLQITELARLPRSFRISQPHPPHTPYSVGVIGTQHYM